MAEGQRGIRRGPMAGRMDAAKLELGGRVGGHVQNPISPLLLIPGGLIFFSDYLESHGGTTKKDPRGKENFLVLLHTGMIGNGRAQAEASQEDQLL
ncbi:uncharacterized protein J3R85_009313 [Psidium guajava]|nr:uncharacterized protein J3R85_009313 [Psidium guajava]